MIPTMIGHRLKNGIASGVTCLLLSVACLLYSCGDGIEDRELPSALVGLDLVLQLPEQISVETRAGETLNGYTITDVRIFQFPASGGSFADGTTTFKMGYYSSATNGWAETDATTGKLKINTGSSDFVDEDCVFYIIVNAGDKLAGITTKAGLQAAALSLSDFSADLVTTEPAVFAYGPVSYKKTPGQTSNPIALLAKLNRMHGKLTVNYTAASGITLTGARVENIPATLYPFPTAKITPAPSTTVSPAVPDYTVTNITLSGNTFSVYLPENLRGNGTATTQGGKNMPANGPGGTLELCTCVVLEGTYNYYPGASPAKDPISVEYRFYPGADMIRNYNIERGKHYTMNVNLTGANSADARVTITDGNVFTITDPEEIEYPDIEF